MRHPNYTHLLYFWTVVREGGVTRAAEALHLTPQTVSGQVKLLEEQLQGALFERHVVIRPLAYVAERDVARYARARRFPIIPCTLCGSQENAQRRAINRMLAGWEREQPGRTESIFSALRNVEAGHLADPALFDFASLRAER